MDTTAAPQIIEHLNQNLNFTPHETKWIPDSTKFILCGQMPNATGVMQIFQLNRKELKVLDQYNPTQGIKCASFGASPLGKKEVALGDFAGKLKIFDLEKMKESYSVQAHKKIVNCIDAVAGLGIGSGAPEIITGGRDGCIRVWDPRQESPVVSLEPQEKEEQIPDAWCVAFGNAYNEKERALAAGYDNGDIKFFDLRTNSLLWDANLSNGVCGLEFDRKDIQMNKLVCTTLEGKIHVFDLRTLHPTEGYTYLTEKGQNATIWGAKHLPQNREVFATQGGNGALNLYKYQYPPQRQIKDTSGKPKGVIGKIELLNSRDIHEQPIGSFDWNKDKTGLCVMSGFDQKCKVVICTKLDTY